MTKIVFDYSGCENVAKINTGLFYEKEFEAKVRSLLSFTALRSWEAVLDLSKGAMRGEKRVCK